MIAYQFYLRDAIKGIEPIGVLPERRRNPKRITDESIINLGMKYFGTNVKDKVIFFIGTVLPERTDWKTEYLNGIIGFLIVAGIAIVVGLIIVQIN